MSKDRRLGRGLAALLGTPLEGESQGDGGAGLNPAPLALSTETPGGAVPAAPGRPETGLPEAGRSIAPQTAGAEPSAAAGGGGRPTPAQPAAAGSGSASPAGGATERGVSGGNQPASETSAGQVHSAPPGSPSASAGSPSVSSGSRSPAAGGGPAAASAGAADSGLLQLKVDEIDDNPFQPRRDFSESEIASLSESLKQHDMLQPVLVRRMGDRYQLISGERRLRAAIQAGWKTIPARLREADDRLVAELAIVENLQRQDLNAVEKALSFRRYLDQHECTQEDLANRLKIDRSTIANLLRLLELPEPVLDALRQGEISAGHARSLLPLGDVDAQLEFCRKIQADGWSVRETERQVQERIFEEDGEPLAVVGAKGKRKKASKNDQVAALEQEFRIALGTKVEIRQTGRGRGRIMVHFTSHQEFDRIRDLLIGEDLLPDQRVG